MPSTLHTTFDRTPRFVLLLVLILADLMLSPLLAGTGTGLRITEAVSAVMMVAALWAAGADPRWRSSSRPCSRS